MLIHFDFATTVPLSLATPTLNTELRFSVKTFVLSGDVAEVSVSEHSLVVLEGSWITLLSDS